MTASAPHSNRTWPMPDKRSTGVCFGALGLAENNAATS